MTYVRSTKKLKEKIFVVRFEDRPNLLRPNVILMVLFVFFVQQSLRKILIV